MCARQAVCLCPELADSGPTSPEIRKRRAAVRSGASCATSSGSQSPLLAPGETPLVRMTQVSVDSVTVRNTSTTVSGAFACQRRGRPTGHLALLVVRQCFPTDGDGANIVIRMRPIAAREIAALGEATTATTGAAPHYIGVGAAEKPPPREIGGCVRAHGNQPVRGATGRRSRRDGERRRAACAHVKGLVMRRLERRQADEIPFYLHYIATFNYPVLNHVGQTSAGETRWVATSTSRARGGAVGLT